MRPAAVSHYRIFCGRCRIFRAGDESAGVLWHGVDECHPFVPKNDGFHGFQKGFTPCCPLLVFVFHLCKDLLYHDVSSLPRRVAVSFIVICKEEAHNKRIYQRFPRRSVSIHAPRAGRDSNRRHDFPLLPHIYGYSPPQIMIFSVPKSHAPPIT